MNNFSIEDIHAIRYANYEKIKNLNPKERREHTEREAAEGYAILDRLRRERDAAANE